MSQSVGTHHEMGDNKAPGGPTSLTSGVSSGVSSTFHGYEDPPGLHEKVPWTFSVPIVINNIFIINYFLCTAIDSKKEIKSALQQV